MEFGLPEADNMQELLERVSGGHLLSPRTSLRQQQEHCRHAAAPTEEERESEDFPSLAQAQGGITHAIHASTPAWPAVPAPVAAPAAACKRWADVVARSPAEA
jgi:hypothetical protein